MNEAAETLHGLLSWIGMALFLLHVAGAIRHEVLMQEMTIGRMLPSVLAPASRRLGGAVMGLLVVVLLLSMVFGRSVQAPVPEPAKTLTPTSGKDAAPLPKSNAPAKAGLEAKADPATNEKAAAPAPLPAAPLPWTVDTGGTLAFTANWNSSAIDGRFKRWSADIVFDPQALNISSISVSIDMASADTGDGQRDTMLAGNEFFDAAHVATARYRSSSIRHLAGDRYEAKGSLTLKGVTKPVTLRFTLQIKDRKATAAGTARIDRTDFGVGTGEWTSTDEIGADVAIAFNFTATAKK